MRRAIQKHLRDFVAILALALVALVVGGVILSHQRFYLPKWVPFVGSDFVKYKAEFATAQSVTPGQGQTVDIAGVPVGDISDVQLKNGRAVVTMSLKHKYTPIYRDATALLRPKTGLNDMIVELTPGSATAGKASPGWTIPIEQTLPNINADEILAGLDSDTRNYLQLLIGGLGEGLNGKGRRLSSVLRRLDPTNRDLLRINEKLAERRVNIRHAIHNFSLLAGAVGDKDRQLSQLVEASNAVFRSFANQDARLRETLGLLPGTLGETRTALAKADRLARVLGPSAQRLRPAARALGPALKATRPFLRETTPVVRDQLRPFARAALPTVKLLRPAADDLASAVPALVTTVKVVNYLFNTLAYNPPGPEEGYLFWLAWANHDGNSVFASQDAMGPIRHGLFEASCSSLALLDQIGQVNPLLGTIVALTNPVRTSAVCPTTSQPGSGVPPGGTG